MVPADAAGREEMTIHGQVIPARRQRARTVAGVPITHPDVRRALDGEMGEGVAAFTKTF
jgi:hypothetical protein